MLLLIFYYLFLITNNLFVTRYKHKEAWKRHRTSTMADGHEVGIFLYLISFLYSGVLPDNEDIIIFKHDSTRMIVYICFILIALMSYVFEADYMCRKQMCCAICMNSSHSENIPQLQRCKTVSSYALYFKYMYKNASIRQS